MLQVAACPTVSVKDPNVTRLDGEVQPGSEPVLNDLATRPRVANSLDMKLMATGPFKHMMGTVD